MTVPLTATARPIHSAVRVPLSRLPADGAGEVGEDRRDHERRHRAHEFDDREHALEVGCGQGEAGDEQCGGDRRSQADAGQPRAEQREALAGGDLDQEDSDTGCEEHHPAQREIWIARLLRTWPRRIAVITAPASSGR